MLGGAERTGPYHTRMEPFSLRGIVERQGPLALRDYARHVNPRFARLLRLIGFDRRWVRGDGPWLWDDQGVKVLDCLAGYGSLNLGRRHPALVAALHEAVDLQLPGWVHFEAPVLATALAAELLRRAPPSLDKVFFVNSGTEGVEAALKFSRAATGRPAFVACERGFHGLTLGALGLNGVESLRRGFGPLQEARRVPFGDLAALEAALAPGDVAAFVVEPIQGKRVEPGPPGWLAEAERLCRRAGTLLVVDEVQTGLGRTGRFLELERHGAEPDMVVLSKGLSGGMVPVGAVLVRGGVWGATFSSIDRAIIHSSTFHQGTLAMAAGLATLHVLESERLAARAERMGDALRSRLAAVAQAHRAIRRVRGQGLMVAFDLEVAGAAAPAAIEKLQAMLVPQAFLMPLLREGAVLAQVTDHRSATVKLMPPLTITEEEVAWIADGISRAASHVDGSRTRASISAVAAAARNALRPRRPAAAPPGAS